MNVARKIIALVIIIFIGLPLLFGIIWAVGMIKATVSPEFLSDLPRKIIADIPDAAEEIFRDGQDKQIISDENIRAWFEAAAETGITPKELMEKTGLRVWMEEELSGSLRQIGQVFRGARRPQPIVINLRPLKEALLHPEVEHFLEETLAHLPPCDDGGQKAWLELTEKDPSRLRLPACRPDLDTAKKWLDSERSQAVHDIDNEVEVFEDVHDFRFLPFGVSGTITFFSYLLFLIPAAFIFLGAVVATSSPSGILRWSGLSALAGAVPALVIALASKSFSLWALKFAPFSWHETWNTELTDLVFEKLKWIPMRIVDQLFSPVISVAGIVCVIGIVLFALSFSARSGSKKA